VEWNSSQALAAQRPEVRRFVLRHVGDEALADDLTQETFLRVERFRSGFGGESSERSWLSAIALNVNRDHYRATGRVSEAACAAELLEGRGSQADEEHALLESEMAACIGEYLAQLPRSHHEVVALHDMAGLTHREIATLLAISVANSRALLHRSRAALRELLKRNSVLPLHADGVPCERRPPPGQTG
jgi:RNA polymerase sigma-70 factor (ECF subfamily)